MRAVIEKSYASGKVQAPTSKSVAHRLMISAAMCDGESFISGITPCEDVLATADCITALGASVTARNGGYAIRGTDMRRAAAEKTKNIRKR